MRCRKYGGGEGEVVGSDKKKRRKRGCRKYMEEEGG